MSSGAVSVSFSKWALLPDPGKADYASAALRAINDALQQSLVAADEARVRHHLRLLTRYRSVWVARANFRQSFCDPSDISYMHDDKLPVAPDTARAIALGLVDFCLLEAAHRDAMTIAVGCTVTAALLRVVRKVRHVISGNQRGAC